MIDIQYAFIFFLLLWFAPGLWSAFQLKRPTFSSSREYFKFFIGFFCLGLISFKIVMEHRKEEKTNN